VILTIYFGKGAVLHFLMLVPLFTHTPQALVTGRYPLQSRLRTSDIRLNLIQSEFYHPNLIFSWMKIVLNGCRLINQKM
jgi:hypothetical protein